MTSLTFAFDNKQYLDEMEGLTTLNNAMAITGKKTRVIISIEFNLHGGERLDHHNKNQMYTMQKPQFYEFNREVKQNRSLLREQTKDIQMIQNKLISEDLMIRSFKEIQKNILPFIAHLSVKFPELKDVI